jgi:hypothetical protein
VRLASLLILVARGNVAGMGNPRFIIPVDSSPLYMPLQHDVAVLLVGSSPPVRPLVSCVFFCSSRPCSAAVFPFHSSYIPSILLLYPCDLF